MVHQIKEALKKFLKFCLERFATAYGYGRETWGSSNVIDISPKYSRVEICYDTVSRVMKELDYSYKKTPRVLTLQVKKEILTKSNVYDGATRKDFVKATSENKYEKEINREENDEE